MKKVFSILMVALLMLSLAACGSTASSTKKTASKTDQVKITMRISHAKPTDDSFQKWAEKFSAELKKQVGDKVKVEIYPNSQLGSETQMLDNMKSGTLEAAIVGRHGEIDPRLDVINLPYIFKDSATFDKILRSNGPLEKKFNQMLSDKGFVNLGWGEIGNRDITSNKPIRHVADLKGIAIRVPNTATLVAAFKALGANPTVVDFSELNTALRTNVVQAQENPPEIIYTNKMYEVQKYLNITEHANLPGEFLVSKKFWDTLPKDIQKAMTDAGKASSDYEVKLNRKRNADLVAELKKQGMTIVKDVDRQEFIDAVRPTYKQFEDKFGADLIQSMIDANK